MKYYKIIEDGTVIGAISSDNFIFRNKFGMYYHTSEEYGELIEYNGAFYRTTWMAPIRYEAPAFTSVILAAISEDEYKAFVKAREVDEEITAEEFFEEEVEEVVEETTDPILESTLDYLRAAKIRELSHKCNKAVEDGFDVDFLDHIEHFSLTTQDQLNLLSAELLLNQGALTIMYHADGEPYEDYDAEEMRIIIDTANKHKQQILTHYRTLKLEVENAQSVEEISAIEW